MIGKIVIKSRRETDVTDEQLFELTRESYQMWIDHGLLSEWRDFTAEDFERFCRHNRRASVFVALDAATGELLGMHTLVTNRRSHSVRGSGLAVSPRAQHRGIATRLLQFEEHRAVDAGYRFLTGRTAIDAVWSVNWHLRNGYRIVGYKRSPKDNHYSYEFRKQLLPPSLRHPFYSLYSSAFFCHCCYLTSRTVTLLTKDSQGQLNILGRMAKRVMERI